MDRCDQCGFVYGDVPTGAVAERLRSAPDRFRAVCSGVAQVAAGRRPEPGVWSALEYACHVRDVLLVQRDRAVLALVEDAPEFARMYRDERVALCHYGEQPLGEVLDQLEMAAGLCALVLDGLDDAAWARPLVYNWPEPTTLDLAWMGRHTLHEVEHHLADVTSVLARVAASG